MAITQIPPSMLANSGAELGMRNRIINGDMRIDQRNAGASVTATSSAAYCIDRWSAGMAGANGTMQRVSSGLTGLPYALRLTGTSSSTVSWCGQKIESANCLDLVGQPINISYYAAASTATSLSVNLSYANASDSFNSITSIQSTAKALSSTLTQYTLTIPALPAGAANGLYLEFVPTGNLGTGTFTITGVQLEKGSTATSFDYRPYGTELALCQRYYYKNTAPSTGTLLTTNGIAQSTTSAIAMTQFSVPMRAAPTALEQSGTASHYQVFVSSNIACSAVPTFLAATVWYATTTATVASGLSSNLPIWITAANTAAYLGWSAEL